MGEIVQRQSFMHRSAGRHRPWTFATAAVSHRFVCFDPEFPQIRNLRPWAAPLLPVTGPDATTDPLVEICKVRLDRHQTKITHPALKVTT